MFGGFADILPAGCTLLAESAVAVRDIDRADLARRIQEAQGRCRRRQGRRDPHQGRAIPCQLTTLEGAILPA